MKDIVSGIRNLESFYFLLGQLQENVSIPNLGLSRASRLPIIAALMQSLDRPILLLTQKTDHALTLLDELTIWAPEKPILYFPEPSTIFYENLAWGENTRRDRLLTLSKLTDPLSNPPIIIAPTRAVMTKTIPKEDFISGSELLNVGNKLASLNGLLKKCVEMGYQSSNTVFSAGQFTQRGGILDIWPPTDKFPTRLEFFGDDIESMRFFDPATQRSINTHERLNISPAREFIINPNSPKPNEADDWNEFHIPLIHTRSENLLHYLPQNSLVVIEDLQALRDTADEIETQSLTVQQDLISEGLLEKNHPLPYFTLGEIEDHFNEIQTLELGPPGSIEESQLAAQFSLNPRFGGQLKLVLEHIRKKQQSGEQVIILSRQAARIQDVWNESRFEVEEEQPKFIEGSLTEGFNLQTPTRINLLTDGEIFGWKRPQPRQRTSHTPQAPEKNYLDFDINELVVHIDHGIGRFKGLVQREIDGIEHEYFCIEYADSDQLYVPIHQADRLSHYIGAKGHSPRISRLSGLEWSTIKSRVKKEVAAIAQDLLELYAKRNLAVGYSFDADGPWQKELEASFPYVETKDQLRVIEEVKRDMENSRPMDRLICGDVGYGKTEIALRAAFKAVVDGKQVAMLVPTTILAQQHYRTFRQRLAAFPVKVEMLSRFRNPKEQQNIIFEISQGTIDIIIGTHRLVQQDVAFKDLGLLIIDEEQRFGVTHKEYLKKLRTEVDVLTMTATPIPRTLYMAMTGVRDISTINTPPEERLPIITHVGGYQPKLVRQAILREIERGGQVFYVHNRVQTINAIKNQISRLVPEARYGVAHGQMPEKELALQMSKFSEGEIDVLVSTSIIESGLDIPNANTLIVDRADMFGLAQLYQLRGRVGRGAQRAYAYFFQQKDRRISEDGRSRLDTIAENSYLGAGFSIAMRDLEIRGAGDFLGTRQHGHIAAVGLNLYTKLLTQAVNEIKDRGELPSDSLTASMATIHPIINIDLPLVVSIPIKYVPEPELRLSLYRRLADIHKIDEVNSIAEELSDRFGAYPSGVENLLYQLKIKIFAERANLEAISIENNHIVIRYPRLRDGTQARAIPNLGPGIIVGKDTIRFRITTETNWQPRLMEVMELLANSTPDKNLSPVPV